jgi:hypothetical protein
MTVFPKLPMLLAGIFLFLSPVFAVEPKQCPKTIQGDIQVERVFKTSIYSHVPGWKEAQQALQSLSAALPLHLILTERHEDGCEYRDESGYFASLSAPEFYDPEDPDGVKEDQLTVLFWSGDSRFVTFVPIQSYDPEHITTFGSPFRVKVKTRLFNEKRSRWFNYDLGMISITLQ